MFGRTLKVSIAKDNGRSSEFEARYNSYNKFNENNKAGEFFLTIFLFLQNLGEHTPRNGVINVVPKVI